MAADEDRVELRSWMMRGALLLGLSVLVLIALPNLLTLGIVAGSGDGAHAGERILDVDGPGFRTATAMGATAAVLVLLALVVLGVMRGRDRRIMADLKEGRSK
jgi:hypothetical protein